VPAERSFTTFLRVRGLLTTEQAAEVDRRVAHSHRWLGDVLVAQGALKASEIATIRSHQRRTPGTRFGALALQLGMVSVQQIEAALAQQRRTRAHPVCVVLTMDVVDDAAMHQALLDYSDELTT
jgi:urease accessory protein UreF